MKELLTHDPVEAIRWRNDRLELLDQRLLPERETWLSVDTAAEAAEAIRNMVVRGAPAIGVTAAYGVVLAVKESVRNDPANWRKALGPLMQILRAARPTAVNLAWSLERMWRRLEKPGEDPVAAAFSEALEIHRQDRQRNRQIGLFGAGVVNRGSTLITHCNTGSLATGGYGTALSVLRAAWEAGQVSAIYIDETRPWLQGSRLTAWELGKCNVPARLIVDGAAASVMRETGHGWAVVGADRIAANGDVANKIGTYALAVAAKYHGFGFMVAAPTSTIDLGAANGSAIPIEQRDGSELTAGQSWELPRGISAYNPVFDVTPADLIDCIVTEQGVHRAPFDVSLAEACQSAREPAE
jgi:methylthioribose-1-phosphate isomerase